MGSLMEIVLFILLGFWAISFIFNSIQFTISISIFIMAQIICLSLADLLKKR